MRGRILRLTLHRTSLFHNVLRFSSSENFVRQFSGFLYAKPSGFLVEKHLGRNGLPHDSHSRAASTSSSTCHHESFRVRSISLFACCRSTSAQSFAVSTNANSLLTRKFTSISSERTERRCWSCEHGTSTGNGLFCPSCKAIQPLDPTVDFFQIFSVDRSFKVDLKVLEQSYKSLQKKLHPDLAGSKSQREREYSADQSAHVIQAYYILIRPLSRARYLLGLHGIRVDEEGTIFDPELLMEIMELRESISEISDAEALKAAQAENRERILNCEKGLESSFRDEDLKRAVSWTQRLAYYIKVGEEVLRKL
ncbi:unnamed protein product [Calypogeia fissa]